MTDEEIVRVVNKLVGYIYPIADSAYDRKVFDNIAMMGSVIDTLVCNIGYMVCDKKDSPFASVQECANKGIDILKTIRSNIDEYLSEVE